MDSLVVVNLPVGLSCSESISHLSEGVVVQLPKTIRDWKAEQRIGGAEARKREAEAEDDLALAPVDVLCPVCETPVSILPGEECPNCGAPLEVPSG